MNFVLGNRSSNIYQNVKLIFLINKQMITSKLFRYKLIFNIITLRIKKNPCSFNLNFSFSSNLIK